MKKFSVVMSFLMLGFCFFLSNYAYGDDISRSKLARAKNGKQLWGEAQDSSRSVPSNIAGDRSRMRANPLLIGRRVINVEERDDIKQVIHVDGQSISYDSLSLEETMVRLEDAWRLVLDLFTTGGALAEFMEVESYLGNDLQQFASVVMEKIESRNLYLRNSVEAENLRVENIRNEANLECYWNYQVLDIEDLYDLVPDYGELEEERIFNLCYLQLSEGFWEIYEKDIFLAAGLLAREFHKYYDMRMYGPYGQNSVLSSNLERRAAALEYVFYKLAQILGHQFNDEYVVKYLETAPFMPKSERWKKLLKDVYHLNFTYWRNIESLALNEIPNLKSDEELADLIKRKFFYEVQKMYMNVNLRNFAEQIRFEDRKLNGFWDSDFDDQREDYLKLRSLLLASTKIEEAIDEYFNVTITSQMNPGVKETMRKLADKRRGDLNKFKHDLNFREYSRRIKTLKGWEYDIKSAIDVM